VWGGRRGLSGGLRGGRILIRAEIWRWCTARGRKVEC
jgi:hypothetical protein